MVQGLGSWVVGFGFGGPVCGLRVEALEFRVQCLQLRFGVQGFGFRFQVLRFMVEGSGFMV